MKLTPEDKKAHIRELKREWARQPEQVEKRKQKWQAMKDKMKHLESLLNTQNSS